MGTSCRSQCATTVKGSRADNHTWPDSSGKWTAGATDCAGGAACGDISPTPEPPSALAIWLMAACLGEFPVRMAGSRSGGGASPVNRILGNGGADGINSIRRAWARADTGLLHRDGASSASRDGVVATFAEGTVATGSGDSTSRPLPLAGSGGDETLPRAAFWRVGWVRTVRASASEVSSRNSIQSSGSIKWRALVQPCPMGSKARRTKGEGCGLALRTSTV